MDILTGGRTNLVRRDGNQVHKHYRPQNATPLFDNDPDREWTALQALKTTGLAPRPIKRGTDSDGPYLIYGFVDGQTHRTPMADLARLLGRLHAMPLPGLPQAANGQGVIDAGLAMADGALGRPPPAPDAAQPLRFCHRDPVPGNIVQTHAGPILIDWQCPAIGDPIEDIAHALSPAMHVLYGGTPPTTSQIAEFLSAYPDQTNVLRYRKYGAAYHWRMACYCHWQISRGNVAYVPALQAERLWLC